MTRKTLVYCVLFIVLFVCSCVETNDTSGLELVSTESRTTSSVTVPENFDWSNVTYIKRYVTDPNTKEKREILSETLKCRTSVPESIKRLPLKSCDEFTEPEKMFAYGIKNKQTEVAGYDVLSIVLAFDRFYRKNNFEPKSIGQLPEFGYFDSPITLEKLYSDLELQPELVSVFSPITKTPLTFNHPDFEAGQMYITRVTDQEYLKSKGKPYMPGTSMDKYLKEEEKGFDTSKMHIYYYRVYGEDLTISEGMWNLSSVQ